MSACLLLATCLWGQVVPKTGANLETTLLALQDAGVDRASITNQLAEKLMALAQTDHQPSRPTVELFADKFVRAIRGKKMTRTQVIAFQSSFAQMLDGARPNFYSASHFHEALISLSIDSLVREELTAKFIAIGEEIRGPDDLSVRDRTKK